MAKSEGSQHIYNFLKVNVKTPFGERCMEELGTIQGLEKDEVKNYILIPTRVKDKDGKEYTASWEIFELHKDNAPIWYRYWDSNEEKDIIK